MGLFDVVDVVAADGFEVEFLGEFEEWGDDFTLIREAMVLQFDEEVVGAKDIDESAEGVAGLVVLFLDEELGYDPSETAGEADEAFGVAGELLHVGSRLVVHAAGVGVGYELGEVAVPLKVFGE